MTKKIAIIGFPIAHSLSPAMHNAAFQALGLDYAYSTWEVEPKDLTQALLEDFRKKGYVGFNVTIPHKEAIIPLLDDVVGCAKTIGAVNTVVLKEGAWIGYNTDATGFLTPLGLDKCGEDLASKKVFVLGAGGAARAVVFALVSVAGVSDIILSTRTMERAKALKDDVQAAFPSISLKCSNLKKSDVGESNLIVNTTPVGMHPDDPILILGDWLHAGQICYDLIYTPKETKFLKEAAMAKCVTIGGAEMLVWQGMLAFELWVGVKAPENVMREALRKGLKE
jgi:shikimate dehydrogenase